MLLPILRCPHCGKTLDQPTTLVCGHTVCSKHVAATPGSRSISTPSQQSQLPSCPILSCFTPTGARPLRPHDDDGQSPTVIYHPPPADLPAYHIPPPPLAQVKIDNPRHDVTLSKVLRVLAPFLESPMLNATCPEMSCSTDAAITHSEGAVAVRPDEPPSLLRPPSHSDLGDVSSLTNLPLNHNSNPANIRVPGAFDTADYEASKRQSMSPSSDRHMIAPVSAMQKTSSTIADSETVSSTGAEVAVCGCEESTKKREELAEALLSEAMCEICYSLFYDPVTTPCQHVRLSSWILVSVLLISFGYKTFCSTCLLRSLDHSPLCPLCRQELPGFAFYHDHPSSRVLLDISCVFHVYS